MNLMDRYQLNNYDILNIVNPQIALPNDCNITRNNGQYFVVIPALLGYDDNIGCALFLTINEKLLQKSDNNGLVKLLYSIPFDMKCLLTGLEDYKLGEDYFLSESLYDRLKREFPDESSSDYSSDESSDDSSDSSDIPPIPPYEPIFTIPNSKYIIWKVEDINLYINYRLYNSDRINEILREQQEKYPESRKHAIMLTHPDVDFDVDNILYDDQGNALSIDEYIDMLDKYNIENYVMKDYTIYYGPDFEWTYSDAYDDLSIINNKDMHNLEWFMRKNSLINLEFSEEELSNLPKTFFDIILNDAYRFNEDTVNNQIYELVQKYYANGQTDDAFININLILDNIVSNDINSMTSYTMCRCSNSIISSTYDNLNQNCSSLYQLAMAEWLKRMLGDVNYYKDWFYMILTGECPIPNVDMIDKLIRLLNEFLEVSLGKLHDVTDIGYRFNCCHNNLSTDNSKIKSIIENYIELLNIIKNNETDYNVNKINIYGTAFGEILPSLSI